MLTPPPAADEPGRIESLRAHHILDTPPEPEFEDIVRLAAQICGTPIALVTFVAETRQWFKAHLGLDVPETPRDHSFCAHAVARGGDDLLIVPDADRDERFRDNPLVVGDPNIRFYAGAPLVTKDGHSLGTLCVIDRQPRELTSEQLVALNSLRRHVMNALTLRRMVQTQQGMIGELERAKDELREARMVAEAATAAQGLYFAAMSHEIRTPISAVVGMTSLLQASPLTAEQTECVETIRSSGEMLLAVINDLLDFSKIESGRIELEHSTFDLRTVVGECVRVLAQSARDKGLKLETVVEAGVPTLVAGDVTRLRQILVNLLSNAVKFTERGRVRVEARPARSATGQAQVHFTVIDTGIGLDAAQQGKLFQVFGQADRSTTRRFGGTGLGLAISKRLAELHGGTMWVESVPGVGSSFHFTLVLPAVASTGAPANAASSEPAFDQNFARQHPCRLLVAEDNPINQKVLRSLLRRMGYEPVIVSDGGEAIDAVKSGAFDVVLMDVEMGGVSGPQATARIRREIPAAAQPVIIALTAHAGAEKRAELLAAGMDEYLTKPLQPERLAKLLSRWREIRSS